MKTSPSKNSGNTVILGKKIDTTVNIQFRQVPMSQTERLRIKNSDAIPVPVMISHKHRTVLEYQTGKR